MADNRKLTDGLVKDLLYIHEDIKEVIDIDSKITDCVLTRSKQHPQAIRNLNLKMFLEYTDYVSQELTKNINSFKLANLKSFKQDVAKYADTYKHMLNISNANSIGTAMTMQQRYLSKVLSEYKRESK